MICVFPQYVYSALNNMTHCHAACSLSTIINTGIEWYKHVMTFASELILLKCLNLAHCPLNVQIKIQNYVNSDEVKNMIFY